MTLPTSWIICTKWAIEKAVEGSEEPVYSVFRTPVGTHNVHTTTGKIDGMPIFFKTEAEAHERLKKLVNDDPKLTRQNLKFSLVEVRYVPNRIKAYGQQWADKYLVSETDLEFKDHKFVDTIK